MLSMTHPAVDQLLVPVIIRIFFVFGVVGVAVGIGLIVNRERMHQLFGFMNYWVSMRRSTKWLSVARTSGLPVQKHRRVAGAAIIVAAALSTWVLCTRGFAEGLFPGVPHSSQAWVLESMRWFLIVGGVFAIVVGGMLALFPDAFQALEKRANQWYSFRAHSQGGDVMHLGVDRWVEGHPRLMGWIITLGALIVAVNYGMLVFAGR